MIIKFLNFSTLLIIGATLFIVDLKFPDINFQKGYSTVFALATCYLIFKVLLDELLVKKMQTSKTRYSLRKATSLLLFIVLTIVVLRIWLPNAQALVVSYGLVAAGVAIALQDVFKNIVGGVIIFLNGLYAVGDRVEINGKYGDVIDIGIFYTSLLEIREWVHGDQATGRIVTVPNGIVLSQNTHNYTKDHGFIWDEIMLPISYKSDWEKAIKLIKEIVVNETLIITQNVERDFTALEQKYYVSKRNVQPDIFLTSTDNWITFHIRYITQVHQRRILHNKLTKLILKLIQKNADIQIASTTLDIVTSNKNTH